MKKYPLIITLVWIALGIFVSSYCYKLGLGQLSSPGPGFMPFWVGLIIACLAFYKLITEFLLKRENVEGDNQHAAESGKSSSVSKLLFIIITLFLYALLLEPLGYIIITLLAMLSLLRFSGYTQWGRIIVYSIIIVGVSYFAFKYLGVKFPAGVLSHFGLY